MIPVHVPQESRRSKELAQELRSTISAFQSRDPKLSADEIRAAIVAVTPAAPGSRARVAAIVAASVIGVGLAGLMGTAFESSKQGRSLPWIPIIVAIAVAFAILALLIARARDQ
jgi:hypothetical protein